MIGGQRVSDLFGREFNYLGEGFLEECGSTGRGGVAVVDLLLVSLLSFGGAGCLGIVVRGVVVGLGCR